MDFNGKNEHNKTDDIIGFYILIGILILIFPVSFLLAYIFISYVYNEKYHSKILKVLCLISIIIIFFIIKMTNWTEMFGMLIIIPFINSFVHVEFTLITVASNLLLVPIIVFSYSFFMNNLSLRKKSIKEKEKDRRATKSYAYIKDNKDIYLGKNRNLQFNDNSIGIDEFGDRFSLSENDLNKHILLVGTTGTGKTVCTLSLIEKNAMMQKKPCIIVDGKGSINFIDNVVKLAEKHNKKIYIFSENSKSYYNPILLGTSTVIRDKIMAVLDWSEPYYKNTCSRFLQLLIQFLDDFNIDRDLINISRFCNIEYLKNYLLMNCETVEVNSRLTNKINVSTSSILNEDENENIMSEISEYNNPQNITTENKKMNFYLYKFSDFDNKTIQGLKNQIEELVESDFGHKFFQTENTINFMEAIKENAVILFSINGLKYAEYIRKLGRLLIHEIKIICSYINEEYRSKKVMAVFEEFATYVTPEAIDIINKARESGLEALISIQGLCDIDIVSEPLTKQVLNNCNTYIIMKMNEHKNAEDIAKSIGTYEDIDFTMQVERSFVKRKDSASMGTAREVDRYIVHPNDIRNLSVGEAFVCKKNEGKVEKIYIDRIMF